MSYLHIPKAKYSMSYLNIPKSNYSMSYLHIPKAPACSYKVINGRDEEMDNDDTEENEGTLDGDFSS